MLVAMYASFSPLSLSLISLFRLVVGVVGCCVHTYVCGDRIFLYFTLFYFSYVHTRIPPKKKPKKKVFLFFFFVFDFLFFSCFVGTIEYLCLVITDDYYLVSTTVFVVLSNSNLNGQQFISFPYYPLT